MHVPHPRFVLPLVLAACGDSGQPPFGSPGADGLVVWLPMHADLGANGTVADASGTGHDGYCVPNFSCPRFDATARTGGAYVFDDHNDFLLVPGVTLTGPYTVALFAGWGGVPADKVIADQPIGATSSHTWQLSFSAGSRSFGYASSSDTGLDTRTYQSNEFYAGTQMHIAATFDGTTKLLYIDGIVRAQAAATIDVSGEDVIVGAGRDAAAYEDPWGGLVGDFRVYNRALTGEEVFALAGQ